MVISGFVFGASRGSGKVEIADNATYASATYITEQSYDSWSDNSIQIDIVKTNLTDGTKYVFVTNNLGGRNSVGFTINLFTPVVITGTNKTNDILRLNGSVIVSGTNLDSDATQDTDEGVYLSNDVSGLTGMDEQTATVWGNSSITFTVDNEGSLNRTSQVYLFVRRDEASLGDPEPSQTFRNSNAYPVSILNALEWAMSLSTQFVDGDFTTAQLSTPSSGTFVAGEMKEANNSTNPQTTPADGFTEYEFCIQASTYAVTGAQYEFRLADETQSGEKQETYTEGKNYFGIARKYKNIKL